MQKSLDDLPLESMMRQGVYRMEVRKSWLTFILDKITWWMIDEKSKSYFTPPDWWRDETDAEFRARIKKVQEGQ